MTCPDRVAPASCVDLAGPCGPRGLNGLREAPRGRRAHRPRHAQQVLPLLKAEPLSVALRRDGRSGPKRSAGINFTVHQNARTIVSDFGRNALVPRRGPGNVLSLLRIHTGSRVWS
jgi:hypothetical protein